MLSLFIHRRRYFHGGTGSFPETMTGANFMLETPNRPTLISQQAAVSPSMTQRGIGLCSFFSPFILPSCHRSIIKFGIRNSDFRLYTAMLWRRIEQMKVVVQPAHKVLDGNVEIPKGVRVWDIDHSPNLRIDFVQSNSESHHPCRFFTPIASFGAQRGSKNLQAQLYFIMRI